MGRASTCFLGELREKARINVNSRLRFSTGTVSALGLFPRFKPVQKTGDENGYFNTTKILQLGPGPI